MVKLMRLKVCAPLSFTAMFCTKLRKLFGDFRLGCARINDAITVKRLLARMINVEDQLHVNCHDENEQNAQPE